MVTTNRETTGFLLSVVFVCLAAGLQLVEGRLPSSSPTLAACVLYAVFAVASAVARRRAIRVAPALATAGGR